MEIEKEFNRQYKLEEKSLLTQIMSKDELFKEYLKTEKKPNLRLFISDKLNFNDPESEINTFVGNSKNEAKLRELINEFDKIKNDLPKSFWSHFLEDIPINATLKKIEKAKSLFVELVEDSGFDIYKETEATAEAIKGCLKELSPEAASSIIKDMTEWTELDDLICWKKTDEQRRKWQRMKNGLSTQLGKFVCETSSNGFDYTMLQGIKTKYSKEELKEIFKNSTEFIAGSEQDFISFCTPEPLPRDIKPLKWKITKKEKDKQVVHKSSLVEYLSFLMDDNAQSESIRLKAPVATLITHCIFDLNGNEIEAQFRKGYSPYWKRIGEIFGHIEVKKPFN